MRNLFSRAGLLLLLMAAISLRAEDVLTWHTNHNLVSADIKSAELRRVLEGVAKLTGWRVYLETNTTQVVSTKFKDVPSGEALHLLLPGLNYALVPQTNGMSRLFVFRTTRDQATELIRPGDLAGGKTLEAKKIPNELIVRLKPGANIDEIARKLGAKVVGKIDGLNAYRLQFADGAAAEAAQSQLGANSNVAGVESNFVVDAPPPVQRVEGVSVPPLNLTLNPPGDSGRVVVGMVDTAMQSLGSDLDKFLVKSISVAGDATPDPNAPTHATSMFQDILRGASSVVGNSTSMQILSVDVYGPNATTSTFDVALGVTTAINNGANPLNLSLGGSGDSQVLRDVIQQAIQKGITVVVAAGNNASPAPFYPAAYPGVISVTAGTGGQLAPYADYASYITLELPGTAPVIFGGSTYLVSGTSTSTALGSGMIGGLAAGKNVSVSTAANGLLNTPTYQFKPVK